MSDAPQAVRVFSGIEHTFAIFGSGFCAVIGALAYFFLPDSVGLYVIALTAIAVLAMLTTRYKLRVSTDGIKWSLLLGWIFPVTRLRYLLDAEIDLYQSFEADKPAGVCVSPFWVCLGEPDDSPCFGTSFNQAAIAALQQHANEAIQQARNLLPPTPLEIRCPLLEKDVAKLDVCGAKRNWQGRILEVEVIAEFSIGSLLLPAGTILEFNGEEYVDPRRQDLLNAALTKAPCRLQSGLEVPADTRFSHAFRSDLGASRRSWKHSAQWLSDGWQCHHCL